MSKAPDWNHNCVGNGCRFAGCENQVYTHEREQAIERIKKLTHPRTKVPLDDVAGMMPTLPEWKKFERKPRRKRK